MIELVQDGAVALLTVRRAAKKNAFTEAMWRALLEQCRALAAACTERRADGPRVVVLQGQAGAFCSGADIEELASLVHDPQALAANHRVVAQAQRALQELPLPTLAVIDGPCFGGGFGLAAACDFRIGSTRARFAVTPARLGLLYSLDDTRRLVRLVGDSRARRLLMRGEALTATAALDWGVLDALVQPEDLAAEATRWTQGLAAQSRTAMAGIKATLHAVPQADAAQALALQDLFAQAFVGPDFAEGAAAFVQRREPRF